MSEEFDSKKAGDKSYVLGKVKQDGKLLDLASEKLKDDEEVAMAAVEQNPVALEFVSERLKNNPEIVMQSVKRVGWTACYASENCRQIRILY